MYILIYSEIIILVDYEEVLPQLCVQDSSN